MKKTLIILVVILIVILSFGFFSKKSKNDSELVNNNVNPESVEENKVNNAIENENVVLDNIENQKDNNNQEILFKKIDSNFNASVGNFDNELNDEKVLLSLNNAEVKGKELKLDFNLKLSDKVLEKFDLSKMDQITFSDMIILDNDNNYIYTEMAKYPFQDFCLKNNLNELLEKYDELKNNSSLKVIPKYNLTKDNILEVSLVIEMKEPIMSKSFVINGSQISLWSEDSNINVDIKGNWKIKFDIK